MQDTDRSNSATINREISAIIFKRSWFEIILGFISVAAIYYFFTGLLDNSKTLIWIASITGAYLLRLFTVSIGNKNSVGGMRAFLFFILLVAAGGLWGIAGYSISALDSVNHKLGILFWLASLILLVGICYSGKISYFLGFTLPAIGFTVVGLNEQQYPWNPLAIYFLVALSVFVFIVLLFNRHNTRQGMYAQIQLNDLKHEYDSLISESKKLQRNLSDTNFEHDETVAVLNKTKKDLQAWHKRSKVLINSLRSQIRIDPVTELPNQKTFTETISKEWQRSTRSKDPVTLAYITVDNFQELKNVKDKKSILSVLKKVGASIKSHGRRVGDLPAHLDDEASFALLLVGANAENASRIVDNIRTTVNELNLVTDTNKQVTVHAGVATHVPDRKSDLDDLYEHAESANYEAEFQGGNRVISYRGDNHIEIIHWDAQKDGELNEENFEMALFSKGFATMKEEVPVDTVFRDQKFSKPTMFAAYSGTFQFTIDNQIYELNAGDYLIIPEQVSFSAEVTGENPLVLYFENTRIN